MRDYLRDEYYRYATVLRVVDGDTLDLEVDLGFHVRIRERFRLNGVDAWETRGEEKEAGLKASAYVEELCPVGSKVLIRSYKQGSFRRWLADIWTLLPGDVPHVCLGPALIDNGHAEPYVKK